MNYNLTINATTVKEAFYSVGFDKGLFAGVFILLGLIVLTAIFIIFYDYVCSLQRMKRIHYLKKIKGFKLIGFIEKNECKLIYDLSSGYYLGMIKFDRGLRKFWVRPSDRKCLGLTLKELSDYVLNLNKGAKL